VVHRAPPGQLMLEKTLKLIQKKYYFGVGVDHGPPQPRYWIQTRKHIQPINIKIFDLTITRTYEV
jgi:hypothetical protein